MLGCKNFRQAYQKYSCFCFQKKKKKSMINIIDEKHCLLLIPLQRGHYHQSHQDIPGYLLSLCIKKSHSKVNANYQYSILEFQFHHA